MELGEYRLATPLVLLLALLIPVGIWWACRRVPRGTIRFSSLAPFRKLGSSLRLRLRFVVPLLRVLVILLLLLALARPQEGSLLAPEQSEGIGLLLVLDASPSMDNTDFTLDGEKVRRIDAVKQVSREFIQGTGDLPGRPQDSIGIITFTGYPVPRAPLTLDHGAVLQVIDTIDTPDTDRVERDRAGRPLYPEEYSTAIGDALARGAQRLRDLDLKSKVMILMSDGSSNDGILDPVEAARIAKTHGVKIYTIGIGQAGTILVEVDSPFFGKRMVPRRSDLDEKTLEEVAKLTGGQYFNAASTDALREVYAEIDQLERSEIDATRYYQWDERFQPLALAALGLLVLEVLLGQTVFRRLP